MQENGINIIYRLERAGTKFRFCENSSQAHLLTVVVSCKEARFRDALTCSVCSALARGYINLRASVFGEGESPQPDLLMSLTDLLAWEGDLIVTNQRFEFHACKFEHLLAALLPRQSTSSLLSVKPPIHH
jgi:hypothetical protein